jgi:PHD/YefM family antitoxin component YafN of YafNO toxin-antitoxin module
MRITATDAKNRFGSICAQAKRAPVFVEKAGQIDTVILSAEQYQALLSQHDLAGRAARKKAFEAEYADWIAAQNAQSNARLNAQLDAHGLPGADLRPW